MIRLKFVIEATDALDLSCIKLYMNATSLFQIKKIDQDIISKTNLEVHPFNQIISGE